jgi:threonine aldolase
VTNSSAAAPVDLRSDTVTKPTPAMRKAMAEAEVGDDVYGEDPTCIRLQERIADLLGKEAALFVPSGTMGNQVSIRVHTTPGDEVIIESRGHSFFYESGALGGISGVQAHPVAGDHGILSVEAVKRAIHPPLDHYPRTRLLVIENTSNSGGGTIYSASQIEDLGALATAEHLRFHLDGARLFNAHVATGTPLHRFSGPCDSVSVCLSKGLGAPVGSVIAGSKDFIECAHRFRKMMGGGMRQAGILAAAGLYALDHHVDRLAEDHQTLRRLADGLANIDGLYTDPAAHPTNIAYVKVTRPGLDARDLVAKLKSEGVLVNPTGPGEIRVVTHLDVDRAQIDRAIQSFWRVMTS